LTTQKRNSGLKRPSVKKWVVYGDLHIESNCRSGGRPIDRHDPKVISLFLQFIKDFKPDGSVNLGDMAHMGPISPWQSAKGLYGQIALTDGEWGEGYLEDEMECCNLFLDLFSEAVPKCKDNYMMEANHEFWLRLLRNNPQYKSLRNDLFYPEKNWRLKERGYKYRTYERYDSFCKENWVQIGNRKVIHGWWVVMNFLAKHYSFMHCPFIMGHVHTAESKSFANTPDGIEHDAFSLGCMCTKEASYHRGRLNRWSQGWAVVYELPNKETIVHQIPVKCNTVIYNGKTYNPKPIPDRLM